MCFSKVNWVLVRQTIKCEVRAEDQWAAIAVVQEALLRVGSGGVWDTGNVKEAELTRIGN